MFPGLESFGNNVFQNCTSLTEIHILETVKTIGTNAFATGGSVDLSLAEDNADLALVDGVLFDNQMTTLISFPSDWEGEYTVPDSVTTILDGVFAGTAITKITLPKGIVSIGANAFKDCTQLTEVVFPERLKSIGARAFQNTKIKSITIGRYVTEIGQYAFADCSQLSEINFVANGSAGLILSSYAFQNCTALTKVEIPYRVRNVQIYDEKNRLDSVTSGIGSYCFAGCTNLSSVTFEPIGAIFTEKLSIGSNAFQNCSSLTTIDLPAHVESFYIPSSSGSYGTYYQSIGAYCFSGCAKLASVTFHRGEMGAYYIGNYAFENCVSLTKIELPNTLSLSSSNSGGNGLFSGCTSLKEVTLPGQGWYADEIFKGCTALETVNVTSRGSSYGLPTGAFEGCIALKSVNLARGLNYIYENAFKGCTSLKSLTLPYGINTIHANVFEGCTALTELVLPESVRTIEDFAFKGCTGLTNFVIPESVQTLGEGVFDGWTAEQTITIPFSESELPAGWNEKWNSGCAANVSWISEEKIAA